MQFHLIVIVCLLRNRLLDYGIETEMYGRKLSLSKGYSEKFHFQIDTV